MLERIQSGQPSLDLVLGGGLPKHAITLLAGAPGAGKTMLAQQYAFTAGTPERPALYVTTVAEPLDKVVRFGQELRFFDPAVVGTQVVYESLAEELGANGLRGVLDRLVVLLASVRPGLLIVDSFRVLRMFASDAEHRTFVSELAQRLSATDVTTIWTGEYRDDLLDTAEAAVADAIVLLRTEKAGQRTLRYLEVLKLRGGSYLPGEHAYRLGSEGIEVFPRLADPVDLTPPRGREPKISLGFESLDALISGGVWRGSSTLVIGPSGAGKTILALEFLNRGAQSGRRSVFATLQESRAQLGRVLWNGERQPFADLIHFHHRSPVDIYIDEWVGEVLDLVATQGAELLVIDSLSDLRLAAPDDKRFEEYTYTLTQRLSRRGITTLMTVESAPVFGLAQMPATALSSLSDNIVLLGYQLDGGQVQRVIHVLKSRASDHDPAIRRVAISDSGVSIGDPVAV
jgi:circadian clock protein KaiC